MAPPRPLLGRVLPAFTTLWWLCWAGCSLEGAGDTPPSGTLYFPTSLALSNDARYLFVVNSNFDRRYGAGSVQAYALDALDARVQARCAGDDAGPECVIDPHAEDLLRSEVFVGSLGRAIVVSSAGDRLYVPTHADGALTYIDVDDGMLACGGAPSCGDGFRRGNDPAQSPAGLQAPPDPIAVAARPLTQQTCSDPPCDAAGDALVMIHRRGEVSLFVDDGRQPPVLVDVLSGLAGDLTGIGFDPLAGGSAGSEQGGLFLISNATSAQGTLKVLHRVGVFVDDPVTGSLLYDLDPLVLRGVSANRSTWAVQADAVGSDERTAVVVSQRPDALLAVDLAADGTEGHVRALAEVGSGASRLAVGQLQGSEGTLDVAIVSCFGERRLYVFDVRNGNALSILTGFSGPFEVVLDSGRQRAYVSDFRSSVVRVVDLSPIARRQPARIAATLGQPRVLEELQ